MRRHEEMLKTGKVSIWIGNMTSEMNFLSYIDDGEFGRDFDFKVNPNFGRELKTEAHAASLEQLVHGFSAWKSFGDACVQRGKELGINSVNCMVVFYAFEYVPTPKINRNARVTFLGTFDFFRT